MTETAAATAPVLTSRIVGTDIPPQYCEITTRHAQSFAASVGDANPRYFDDERADGLLAPPLLAVAFTTPLTQSLRDGNCGPMPATAFAKPLHFSERLLFHRSLRPEMHLSIGGKVTDLRAHPKGALLTLRYQASACDIPVFTEEITLLLRGVGVVGAAPYEKSRRIAWSVTPLWREAITIDPMLPYLYDACSHIINLIHTSPKVAHASGLPSIILQGTATLALAARQIVDHEAQGDAALLREIYVRFATPVTPATTIEMALTDRRQEGPAMIVNFLVIGADERPLLSNGMARIAPWEE